jgi:hypothetical protein
MPLIWRNWPKAMPGQCFGQEAARNGCLSFART